MNLISIVIPVYNCEKYIAKCIDSIINDYEYEDLELILINDGSKDKSGDIIAGFAKKDSRIKQINQENSGPSAARNRGLLEATGRYIMFIDADDFLDQGALKKFRELLISNKYDTILFNYKRYDEHNEIEKNKPLFKDGYRYNYKNKENIYKKLVSTWRLNHLYAKFYYLDIIRNNKIIFNEDIHIGEDNLFNMEYFYYSQKGIYKDLYLYNYRYNPESLTKTFNLSKFEDLKITHAYRMEFIQRYDLDNDVAYNARVFTLKNLFTLVKNALENNISYEQIKKILKEPFFYSIINDVKIHGFKNRLKRIILRNNLFRFLKLLIKVKVVR